MCGNGVPVVIEESVETIEGKLQEINVILFGFRLIFFLSLFYFALFDH